MATRRKRANIRGKEPYIVEFVMNHPDMRRTPLAEKMAAEIKWEGKEPEVEVLERKISHYRNRKPSPEDQPWNLSMMKDYPIPPEAVPAVVKAWVCSRERSNCTLTVREAKWVSRLYTVTDNIEVLVPCARVASRREVLSEILSGFKQGPNWDSFMLVLYRLVSGEEISWKREAKILEARTTSYFSKEQGKEEGQ